jgi:hypothetical protein
MLIRYAPPIESMDKQHGRIVFVGSTTTRLEWAPNAGLYSPEQRETLITSTGNMAKGIEEHPDGKVYETGMRSYAMSKLLMMMFMWVLHSPTPTQNTDMDQGTNFSAASMLIPSSPMSPFLGMILAGSRRRRYFEIKLLLSKLSCLLCNMSRRCFV